MDLYRSLLKTDRSFVIILSYRRKVYAVLFLLFIYLN